MKGETTATPSDLSYRVGGEEEDGWWARKNQEGRKERVREGRADGRERVRRTYEGGK